MIIVNYTRVLLLNQLLRVWVGGGSKVVGKVNIGDNVIIAPNSVVLSDTPSNCICGGSPAKVLKEINTENYSEYSDYINSIN